MTPESEHVACNTRVTTPLVRTRPTPLPSILWRLDRDDDSFTLLSVQMKHNLLCLFFFGGKSPIDFWSRDSCLLHHGIGNWPRNGLRPVTVSYGDERPRSDDDLGRENEAAFVRISSKHPQRAREKRRGAKRRGRKGRKGRETWGHRTRNLQNIARKYVRKSSSLLAPARDRLYRGQTLSGGRVTRELER